MNMTDSVGMLVAERYVCYFTFPSSLLCISMLGSIHLLINRIWLVDNIAVFNRNGPAPSNDNHHLNSPELSWPFPSSFLLYILGFSYSTTSETSNLFLLFNYIPRYWSNFLVRIQTTITAFSNLFLSSTSK